MTLQQIERHNTAHFNGRVRDQVSKLYGIERVTIGYYPKHPNAEGFLKDKLAARVVVELGKDGIEEEVVGVCARLKRSYDFDLVILDVSLGGTIYPQSAPKIWSVGKNAVAAVESFVATHFPEWGKFEFEDYVKIDDRYGASEIRLESGELVSFKIEEFENYDRWANSRAYEGPIPPTFPDLNRLLTQLEGGRLRGRTTYAVFYDDAGWFNTHDGNYHILRRTRCYPWSGALRCPVQLVPEEGIDGSP